MSDTPTTKTEYVYLQPKSNRSTLVVVLVLVVLLPILLCVCCLGSVAIIGAISNDSNDVSGSAKKNELTYSYYSGKEDSNNKFLSIPVEGAILVEGEDDGLGLLSGASGNTYGYKLKNDLMLAAADTNIKGVILEINSPGGTITGSQAISDGIDYYKDKSGGKPVIALVKGLGASGAYWAAVSADAIYADKGSLTGSIGVIYGPFVYYDKVLSEGSLLTGEVLTQNGIESRYFTAGGSKDVGNPYRRLTEEEVKHFQNLVNNDYETFVNHVAAERGISANTIKNVIKAQVYDNKSAQELKLIDGEANREKAYSELATRATITDNQDYQIVRKSTPASFLSDLLGAFGNRNTPTADYKLNSTGVQTSCPLCGRPVVLYGNPLEY